MLRIRSGCLQATFCRLKETVTLPQARSLVKRGSSFDAPTAVRLPADETAAPSRVKALKEKRLGKALLNF